MSDPTGKKVEILGEIFIELERAETLYPEWPTDPVHAVAVLAEECGEAVRAANDVRWQGADIAELKKELIQTGAMVFRCLLNLER